MKTITIENRIFSPYIGNEDILELVRDVADKMNSDLKDENPLFLVILKGSFMFASDLVKMLNFPCELAFMSLSSYRGTESKGSVDILSDLKEDIEGRTVVILEDIIDSGCTMDTLLSHLKSRNPKDIKIATLFLKPSKLKYKVKVDYSCFAIGDEFIVGYGLDYNQKGRNLPDVYRLA